MLSNPSRRQFIQATAAVTASLVLPRSLFARSPDRSFWFIHADTLNSWRVADPVRWSLDHAHEPVLERAKDGLAKLIPDDGDRIIRLVVRRCRLNLLELQPNQVVVHYWSQHGLADLRAFFKQHRLAHPHVEVVLNDRKKEVVTTQTGDDFQYGDRLAADFPLDIYLGKWACRFNRQPDDFQPAPGTWSGFAWEAVEDNRIPWATPKSAWRRATAMTCLNCDQPTLLVNFGNPWTGLLDRLPRFTHACGTCRRSFADDSVTDVAGWMATNLDPEVRPGYDMLWDRRVARGSKASA